MTIAEHKHEDLTTKEEVADFKIVIADAILTLRRYLDAHQQQPRGERAHGQVRNRSA